MGPSEAFSATAEVLKKRHYRVLTCEADGAIFADQFRFARFGTYVSHLSLILILIGAVIGNFWGFSDDHVEIAKGATYDVRQGQNFSVRSDDFQVEYYPNKAPKDFKTISKETTTTNGPIPKDFRSDVTVIENGKEVLKKTIRVNDPLSYKGVNFYLSDFFYTAKASGTVTATDSEGKPVMLALSDVYLQSNL